MIWRNWNPDVVEAHPNWTVDVRLVDAKTGDVVRDWWSPAQGEKVVVPRGRVVDVRQRESYRHPRYDGYLTLTRDGC